MKQPPSIEPAAVPGPDYDPMDRIVEDLENVESFLSLLEMRPQDLNYLNAHLPGILASRRTLSHQLEMLAQEPYNYSVAKLESLHLDNEKLFTFLERVVGTMDPWTKVLLKNQSKRLKKLS